MAPLKEKAARGNCLDVSSLRARPGLLMAQLFKNTETSSQMLNAKTKKQKTIIYIQREREKCKTNNIIKQNKQTNKKGETQPQQHKQTNKNTKTKIKPHLIELNIN